MIKKYLAKFTFVASVVLIDVFVSGCGGDTERLDVEKQIIKNANLIFIMKNMNIGTSAFMEKIMNTSPVKVISLNYDGESCVSLGFSSVVSLETPDDIFDATITEYLDNSRTCIFSDFGDSKDSGNKSLFLVGNE